MKRLIEYIADLLELAGMIVTMDDGYRSTAALRLIGASAIAAAVGLIWGVNTYGWPAQIRQSNERLSRIEAKLK